MCFVVRAYNNSWLGLLVMLRFCVDSTLAASRGSAFGLASFFRCASAPTTQCHYGSAFWSCLVFEWTRRLQCLVARPLASPLFSDVPQCLQHIMARPFGRAWFFVWTRRLGRLRARPPASLLLRMTPVPAATHGLAFWTCSNVFQLDSMLNCSVLWLGLWARLFS